MRAEHGDYLDACARLSAPEIALILRQDPDWTLPRGTHAARRMAEAKRLLDGRGEAMGSIVYDEQGGPMPIRAGAAAQVEPVIGAGGWRRRGEDEPSPWDADGVPVAPARHEYGEGGTSRPIRPPRGRAATTAKRPSSAARKTTVDQPTASTPELVRPPTPVEPAIAEADEARGPIAPPSDETSPPPTMPSPIADDVAPAAAVSSLAAGAVRDLWTGENYADVVEAAYGTGKTVSALQQAIKLSRRGCRTRFADASNLEAESSRVPPRWSRERELAAIAAGATRRKGAA